MPTKAVVCPAVCRKCGEQTKWQDLQAQEEIVIPGPFDKHFVFICKFCSDTLEHIFYHKVEQKKLWDIASTALYNLHLAYIHKFAFEINEILNYIVSNYRGLPLRQEIDHKFKTSLTFSMAQKGHLFQKFQKETGEYLYRLLPNFRTTTDTFEEEIPEQEVAAAPPPRTTGRRGRRRGRAAPTVPAPQNIPTEPPIHNHTTTTTTTTSTTTTPRPVSPTPSSSTSTPASTLSKKRRFKKNKKGSKEDVQLVDGVEYEPDDIASLYCTWCQNIIVFDIRKLNILNPNTGTVMVPSRFDKAYTFACATCNEGIYELRHDKKTWRQVACTALSNMERIHGRQFFPFPEVVRFIDSHYIQVCHGLKYVKQWPGMLNSSVSRSDGTQICISGAGEDEYWGLYDENNKKPPKHNALVVEKILQTKKISEKSKHVQYLVKWEGFSETWATWEKRSTLPFKVLNAWRDEQKRGLAPRKNSKQKEAETTAYTVFDIVSQKCSDQEQLFARSNKIAAFSYVIEGQIKEQMNVNENKEEEEKEDEEEEKEDEEEEKEEEEEIKDAPAIEDTDDATEHLSPKGQLSNRRKKRKSKEKEDESRTKNTRREWSPPPQPQESDDDILLMQEDEENDENETEIGKEEEKSKDSEDEKEESEEEDEKDVDDDEQMEDTEKQEDAEHDAKEKEKDKEEEEEEEDDQFGLRPSMDDISLPTQKSQRKSEHFLEILSPNASPSGEDSPVIQPPPLVRTSHVIADLVASPARESEQFLRHHVNNTATPAKNKEAPDVETPPAKKIRTSETAQTTSPNAKNSPTTALPASSLSPSPSIPAPALPSSSSLPPAVPTSPPKNLTTAPNLPTLATTTSSPSITASPSSTNTASSPITPSTPATTRSPTSTTQPPIPIPPVAKTTTPKPTPHPFKKTAPMTPRIPVHQPLPLPVNITPTKPAPPAMANYLSDFSMYNPPIPKSAPRPTAAKNSAAPIPVRPTSPTAAQAKVHAFTPSPQASHQIPHIPQPPHLYPPTQSHPHHAVPPNFPPYARFPPPYYGNPPAPNPNAAPSYTQPPMPYWGYPQTPTPFSQLYPPSYSTPPHPHPVPPSPNTPTPSVNSPHPLLTPVNSLPVPPSTPPSMHTPAPLPTPPTQPASTTPTTLTTPTTPSSTTSSVIITPPPLEASAGNALVLSNFSEPLLADVFVFWEHAPMPSGFVRCSLTNTLHELRAMISEDEIVKTEEYAFVYYEAPVRSKQEAKVFVGECTSVCPETQRRTVVLRKDGNKL